MSRGFDGATLEPEFSRGRIVMDRRVGVVGLRVQHLLRLAPGAGEPAVARGDLGVECIHRASLERRPFKHGWTRQPSESRKLHVSYAAARQTGGCACMANP